MSFFYGYGGASKGFTTASSGTISLHEIVIAMAFFAKSVSCPTFAPPPLVFFALGFVWVDGRRRRFSGGSFLVFVNFRLWTILGFCHRAFFMQRAAWPASEIVPNVVAFWVLHTQLLTLSKPFFVLVLVCVSKILRLQAARPAPITFMAPNIEPIC